MIRAAHPAPARRWALLCAVLVAGLLGLGPGIAAADDADGLIIERFDARLDVGPSGTVEVVEELVVDFGEDERRGIVRRIPVSYPLAADDSQVRIPEDREPADYRRVIAIDAVAVTATAPDDVEVSRDGDVLVVRIGDPDQTVTGTQTYELRYRVSGALNAFADRAELTWDVTGHGWEGPILSASAVVTGPGVLAGACARGREGDDTTCERAEVSDGRATFATGRLDPGEGLTVSVGFPLDAVAVPAPLLEERWRLSAALAGDRSAWPLAAVAALVGLVGVAFAARVRRRRVRAVTPPGVTAAGMFRGDPPDGLRPAQLRMLATERADDVALGATLLDLAARGYVEITPLEESAEDADADDTRYRFRRTAGDAGDLLEYERTLLAGMFAQADTITGEAFAEDHAEDRTRFSEQVAGDALGRGWFSEPPVTARVRRALLGVVLMAAAVALLVVALVVSRVAVAAVPLLLAAVVIAVLVYRLPTRTVEGKRLLAEAQGFEAYLTGSGVPGDDRPTAERFGRTLPAAMAMGVAPRWVARFEESGVPVQQWMPAYYLPIFSASGGNPSGFASSVSSFGSSVTPAPSTSTSGGGVSAGGGAGGGGGGSW